MNAASTLAEIQGWLFEHVTAPTSEQGASAVERARDAEQDADALIVGGRMPASARIAVYRHAYVARLIECLADDYPALQHALGQEPFAELCRDFIAQHPPASPSLNYYGAPFAGYCAGRRERWSGVAAELAALEWAIVEAIHAEEGEQLELAGLAQLSPDEWSRARLVPSPALRLLTTTYAVAEYYQAFQDGTALSERWPEPESPPSAVAVCRRGSDVWRIRLTPALARLLGALMGAVPLLAALEHVSEGGALAAPEELQGAFRDWVSCGLFCRVALDV